MLYFWIIRILYLHTEFVSIDKQSDDNIVHLNRFFYTLSSARHSIVLRCVVWVYFLEKAKLTIT